MNELMCSWCVGVGYKVRECMVIMLVYVERVNLWLEGVLEDLEGWNEV